MLSTPFLKFKEINLIKLFLFLNHISIKIVMSRLEMLRPFAQNLFSMYSYFIVALESGRIAMEVLS